MAISTRTITATLVTASSDIPLKVIQGSIDANEAMSPFVGGDITIAHPGLATMALLTPVPGQKPPIIRLNLSKSPGSSPRSSLGTSLNVSARQIIAATGEVGINLVNDEALVEDYSPSAVIDLSAKQAKVADIVSAVLSRAVGQSLSSMSAAVAAVAFKTYQEATNIMPGGSFESSSGLWAAARADLSQWTGWSQHGSYSLRVKPNATTGVAYATLPVSLSEGQLYTMTGYIRTGATPQTGTLDSTARALRFRALVNGAQTIFAVSNQAPNTANTTTAARMQFTVPMGATDMMIDLMNGATSTAENSIAFDSLLLVEGDGTDTDGTPLAYFDGNTPDTVDYNYDWTGNAGLSSSTRTPLVQRSPDILKWQPGTGGMSFLQPILQATGLRLFQNLDRTWSLVDNSYIVPGQTRIAYGINLYGATDLASRTATQTDGLPLFADAVVLNYHWIESGTGKEKTATDVAAPAGYSKPYMPDTIEGPFPGPGRAAYVLSRLQARARQLQVTAAVDYSVRPGQEAVITTVDGGVQTGYVDAVTWDFGNDEMTVVTKALVATQPNSVGRAPASQTIGSVTGTIADYTN